MIGGHLKNHEEFNYNPLQSQLIISRIFVKTIEIFKTSLFYFFGKHVVSINFNLS